MGCLSTRAIGFLIVIGRRSRIRQGATLITAVAVVAASFAGTANAATTTLDSSGQLEVNGQRQFPVGLIGAPADEISAATAEGFTFFQFTMPATSMWSDPAVIASAQAYDATAAVNGAWTLMNLRGDDATTPWLDISGAELAQVAATVGTDAGLGLWRGDGEPQWHGTDPTIVASRAMDAHLWAMTEAPRGTVAQLAAYSPYTDIHAVDIFPVKYGRAHPDLHQVGLWTATIRAATPSKAIWTILQACSASSQATVGSGGAYVLPTLKQSRFMAFDAIANGARGLEWFGVDHAYCMNPADAAAGFNYTFMHRISPLLAQLHAMSPALAGQHIRIAANKHHEAMILKGGGKVYTVRLNLSTFAVTVTASETGDR
jgi:hypothetical protein